MRHFTKFLMLCLAVCILPSVASAQIITVTPPYMVDDGSKACTGFQTTAIPVLLDAGICGADQAAIIAAMTDANYAANNINLTNTCGANNTSTGSMVEVYFVGVNASPTTGDLIQTSINMTAPTNGSITTIFPPGSYELIFRGHECDTDPLTGGTASFDGTQFHGCKVQVTIAADPTMDFCDQITAPADMDLAAGTCHLEISGVLDLLPAASSLCTSGFPNGCPAGATGTAGYIVEISVDGMVLETYTSSTATTVVEPNSDDTVFGDGDHEIVFTITNECNDAAVETCEFDWTINQNSEDVLASLACNNLINASLSVNCEVEVTTDMMLEGDSPCITGYTFDIENTITGEVLTGTTITAPGTYQVTVTDAEGVNSCWGTVVAEDKLPPVLMCSDITVSCTDDVTPNAPLVTGTRMSLSIGTGVTSTPTDELLNATSEVVKIDFTTNAGVDATLQDITIELDVAHTNISELTAILVSPDNDSLIIFDQPLGSATDPNCLRDDLFVTFEDGGINPHSLLALDAACRPFSIPSVIGSFDPQTAFSTWRDSTANGVFSLCIIDNNPEANHGSVRDAALTLRYATGDTIAYPTDGDYTAIAGDEGCYTIANHPEGVCGAVKACYVDEVVEECAANGTFTKIERKWTVWDAAGNMDMEVCVINVQGSNIVGANLNSVGMIDFDGLAGRPYFTCQDIFDVDENGHPSPSVTGRPRDLSSTDMEFCGNIEMTYTDTRIDVCPGSYKLIRNWILIDWCGNGQPVEFPQIIKVLDERPPITTCSIVDCHEVPITDPFTCTTSFDVPAPIVLNECGGYTWAVSYLPANLVPGFVEDPDGACLQPDSDLTAGLFIDVDIERMHTDSTPITITDLPLGQVWIRYRVVDECGNASPSGAGACEIRIVDEAQPNAVCDEHTTISLGVSCAAQIRAKTIDDLSFDNCSDTMLVYEISRGGSFGPTADFTKSDLNQTVSVTLRVTDQAGNQNECSGEVQVQDKFVPIFTSSPQDVTISCEYTEEELMAAIGECEAVDNCPGCFRIERNIGTPSIGSCGDGSIQVTWDLYDTNQLDGNGNELKVNSKSQRITFANTSLFRESNINWPSDRTNLECSDATDVNATGEPSYNSNACSLIAVSHEDLVFDEVEDACRKVLRTWSIIDWCQFDDNLSPNPGLFTHVQVLKMFDNAPPVLSNGNDVQVCATETCEAGIDIDLTASDECTETSEIIWSWTLDYGSDDSIDQQDSGVKVDSVLNLGGTHPVGVHRVTVTLEDHCGNVSDPYTFNITIQDCKEPTPYCFSSTTTVVMPSTGSVEIWAEDYNVASTDQCPGDLRYSFSSNPSDASLTLTCADLRDGVRRVLELEMWVHDAADNSDFCTIKLDLQDNGTGEGACPDTLSPSAAIQGFIRTEQNEMVNNVAVQVTSAQPEFPLNFTTGNTGNYTFNNLLTGHTYDITSSKNDDFINGVSTLDIVLIQKHILGLTLLDSPYKIIAADADNNQYISAADLVWIRKLVLGQVDEFPNGQDSWRFVDEDFAFSNRFNPFPYDEIVNISDLSYDETSMDFMAVKIGDVNENANPTNYTGHITEVRSNQTIEFAIEDQQVKAGEQLSIPVTANNFEEMVGFQFTMGYDMSTLEFAGISKAALEINENNLGLTDMDRGLIAFSWNDIDAQSFEGDEVLFTIEFNAVGNANLSTTLDINSRITNAEAYTNDLSMVNTKLVFSNGTNNTFEVSQFELYQNNPNPFNSETSIGFNLPKSGEAVLSVFDVTGKRLIRIVEDFEKGFNEISINLSELGVQGVMYYTLESEGSTATKKMVGVK